MKPLLPGVIRAQDPENFWHIEIDGITIGGWNRADEQSGSYSLSEYGTKFSYDIHPDDGQYAELIAKFMPQRI